jgi:hypothetical protein
LDGDWVVKLEVDLNDEWVDRIVAEWLKEHLDMIENWDGYLHPDDIEYNEKLLPALKRVLDYLGVPENE